MNPSSTSNSDTPSRFPRLTKPAMLALAMLLATRIAFFSLPIDRMTHVDSRRLQNLFMVDLICEMRKKTDPEVLIVGTSRVLRIPARQLERPLNLPPGSVLNLSRGGADFFFIETLLRRHPDVVQGAKVILIDLMPSQATESRYFNEERGKFFLLFASFQQRLAARGLWSKFVAIGDLVIPAASHSQDPFQWRTGIQHLAETPRVRHERLLRLPTHGFERWNAMLRRASEARRENANDFGVTDVLFSGPELVPNDMNSLRNIIDLVPDDCRVLLVWLPFRDDVRKIVEQSPDKSQSRENFREFLESIDDPKVELHWFEEANAINIRQEDYSPDGSHFTRPGLRKVARVLVKLIRPHLEEAKGDRASPKS